MKTKFERQEKKLEVIENKVHRKTEKLRAKKSEIE